MVNAFIIVLTLAGVGDPATKEVPRSCPMEPAHIVIQLPESGMTWLDGEEFSGACETVPKEAWSGMSRGSQRMVVYADGPTGSGRFWRVTVGVAAEGETPFRGFCLTTSTVGWRTLQRYDRVPLPWIEDLDNNGEPEVLIWTSFPLSEDPSMAEFGLFVWVYDTGSDGALTINWDLTRNMATEIAAAYRGSLGDEHNWAESLRAKASEALARFASERCRSAAR